MFVSGTSPQPYCSLSTTCASLTPCPSCLLLPAPPTRHSLRCTLCLRPSGRLGGRWWRRMGLTTVANLTSGGRPSGQRSRCQVCGWVQLISGNTISTCLLEEKARYKTCNSHECLGPVTAWFGTFDQLDHCRKLEKCGQTGSTGSNAMLIGVADVFCSPDLNTLFVEQMLLPLVVSPCCL